MADENEKSEPTAEGFEPAPEPRALSEAEIHEASEQAADGIAQLGGGDASSTEVSRQLEELTNVVLSSAEVSTRSASVAADVSGDMKQVTERIADDHKRTVFHSRTLMIAMLVFVVLAVGSLFAVSVRLLSNVRQLDALTLQVGKRAVELDETIGAFGKASRNLFELSAKLETFHDQQAAITPRFDAIERTMSVLTDKVNEVNLYRPRPLDDKFQAIQKQVEAVNAQVTSLEKQLANTKPPADEYGAKTLAELQAMNKSLVSAMGQLQKDVKELKARPVYKPVVSAPKPQPQPKPQSKPQPKPVAKPKPEPVAKVDPVPALPPRAPTEDVVVYPRPSR